MRSVLGVVALLAVCEGCSKDTADWIGDLHGGDVHARTLAVNALRSSELPADPRAARILLGALLEAQADGDPGVRDQARAALADFGAAAYPTLVTIICSSQNEPAARQLLFYGADVVEELARALTRADCPNRRTVALILAGLGAPAIGHLLAHLAHPDPKTREYALFALGQMGSRAREAIPALTEFQKRADDEQRRHATEVLAKIRS